MSAAASGFLGRSRAAEGYYFNGEERQATIRHLERMVEAGRIEKSALEKALKEFYSTLENQVTIKKAKDTKIFEYTPSLFPSTKPLPRFNLGTQFSLGRGRWVAEDTSIFSISDGKKLASTPPTAITNYENLRMAKIQRAALETPTMAGYRLLPEFTPGRAMLWGTVLALWGTGAVVASAMRSLDIQGPEDAPTKIRDVMRPLVQGVQSWLAPLKGGWLTTTAMAVEGAGVDTAQSELVRQLRGKLRG